MIYFVHDEAADLVKIGYSKDPWRRLNKIQSDCPREVVIAMVIDGDRAAERGLHERFADEHVRGEWFRWSGPVADHVSALSGMARPKPPLKPPSIKKQVNCILLEMGFGRSSASRMLVGRQPWPLSVVISIWRTSGIKVGPIADAPDEDILVLAKYASLKL
jgi:hypothetical protein